MSKLRKQGTVKWLCVCHSGWYLHSGVCVFVCLYYSFPFCASPPGCSRKLFDCQRPDKILLLTSAFPAHAGVWSLCVIYVCVMLCYSCYMLCCYATELCLLMLCGETLRLS
jgi:hypothetical protein